VLRADEEDLEVVIEEDEEDLAVDVGEDEGATSNAISDRQQRFRVSD